MATATTGTISIAAEEFPAHLTGLYSRLDSYSFADFTREVGLRMALEGVKNNFDNSQTADGIGWAPRKDPGDGHPLLILTTLLIQSAVGNGPGAITYIEDRSVTFGVDGNVVEYAPAHEFGTENMPARPYMAVPDEYLDAIGEALADHLLPELFG